MLGRQTRQPSSMVQLGTVESIRTVAYWEILDEIERPLGATVVQAGAWDLHRHLGSGSVYPPDELVLEKLENHAATDLYFMYYNFARVHQTLSVTPAMEAGIADHV